MKNLTNELASNFNYNTSIEAPIKKIYKLKSREIDETSNNKLIISKEDSSLIEVDIIIDISTNL